MYDFSLDDLESDDKYLSSTPEEQQQYSSAYVEEHGTQEALDRLTSETSSERFQSLLPEEQKNFKQSYLNFYGIEEPVEDVSLLTDIKDVGLSGLSGTSSLVKAVGMAAGWLGFDDTKDSLLDSAKVVSDFYQGKISKQGKQVQKQSFLSDKDGQWFGDNAFKKVAMTSAESVPLMIATAPIGGAASAVVSKAKFLPNFIRALEGSGKVSEWSHNLLTFGASEAGTSALISSADAGLKVANMSNAELAKTPVYRELLKTMSPEEAKEEFRGQVEYETFKNQSAATLAGAAMVPWSGGVMPRLFKKGSGKVGGSIAKGVLEEAPQEFFQSGLEKHSENVVGAKMFGTDVAPWQGTLEDAALGAASGAMMGGGAAGGHALLSVGDVAKQVENIPLEADPDDIVKMIEGEPEKLSVGPELTDYDMEALAALREKINVSNPEQLKVFLERLAVAEQPPAVKRIAMDMVQAKLNESGVQVPQEITPTVEPEITEQHTNNIKKLKKIANDRLMNLNQATIEENDIQQPGSEMLTNANIDPEIDEQGIVSQTLEGVQQQSVRRETDSIKPVDKTPDEIKSGIEKIAQQLNEKLPAGKIVKGTGNEAEVTGGFPSTAPEWLKQKNLRKYDKENRTDYAKIINEQSIRAVLANVSSGKKLTPKQEKVYNYVKIVAKDLQANDTELVAGQEQEGYVQYMQGVLEDLQPLAKTEKQKKELKEWFNNYFKPRYLKLEKARLQANSRVLSPMITGPSNFPSRSNSKKGETAYKRSQEVVEFSNKATAKMKRKLRGNEAISSTDPDATKKLKKKLRSLESAQVKMKSANKILRSKKISKSAKVEKLAEIGFSKKNIDELFKLDYMGRLGFPPFSLTNNNAKIKAVKGRISTLEDRKKKAEETGGKESKDFDGGSVEINYEDGFIRVFHDEKPSAESRAELKKNGFRWSPKDGAWHRKITNPARWAAEKVTGVVLSAPTLKETDIASEKTGKKHNAKAELSKLGTRDYIKKYGSKKLKASYFILEKLLPKGALVDVLINVNNGVHKTKTMGLFNPDTNTVEMYHGAAAVPESFANTLLHEIVHAITFDKLKYDTKTNAELDKLRNRIAKESLSKSEFTIYKRFSGTPAKFNDFIVRLRSSGKSYEEIGFTNRDMVRTVYMLLSNDELLANATHPAMMDLLSGIPATKKKAFMDKIKSIFKRIFGWSDTQYTAYEQAMATIGELNREVEFTLSEKTDGIKYSMAEEVFHEEPYVEAPYGDLLRGHDRVESYAAKTKYHDMFERFVAWIADKEDPRRRVMNRAEHVTAKTDILQVERLRGSKTADEVERFMEKRVEPILKILARNNVSTSDLEEYAHAMHAPERNKRMQQVNARRYIDNIKKFLNTSESSELREKLLNIQTESLLAGETRAQRQDKYLEVLADLIADTNRQQEELNRTKQIFEERVFTEAEIAKGTQEFLQKRIETRQQKIDNIKSLGKMWKDQSPRYAGITDKEANAIVSKWKQAENFEAVNDAHKLLLNLGQFKLDVLKESGQLSDIEYKSLTDGYTNYVPLHRDVEGDTRPATGRVTGPTGKPLQVAKGSIKEVVNIFAHSVRNAQAAITRSNKAEGGATLLEFVKENPNIGITIGKQKKVPTHDREGNIVMYESPSEANDEIFIRKDGERHVLTFDQSDKQLMRFLDSIKNADPNIAGPVKYLAKVTRVLAALNTTFSPEFTFTNFSRDIQTALIHMNDSNGKKMKIKVIKGVFPAMKGILESEFGKDSGKWSKVYKDFKAHGGKIGWMQSYDTIEDMASSLEKDMNYFKKGHIVKKTFKGLADTITKANVAVENAVRLSFYDQLVKSGIDKDKAAYEAKNLTVDFNRRGTASPVINSLYLFFNAGVQGNIRAAKALVRSSKARAMVGSIVISGFALQMLGYSAGDDEEGKPLIDDIPDYVRERNMVFIVNGKTVTIPMPYVYNIFFGIGTEMARAIHHGNEYKAGKGGVRLASMAMNTLNPLQSATIMQTLTPSVIDPLTMISENKDWTGRNLMPVDNPYGVQKKDAYRFWNSSPILAKSVAQGLNKLTGGKGEYGEGGIDVSPETLELWYNTFTGSAGKFAKNVLTTSYDFYRGEKIETNRIPFVRKVTGDIKTGQAISERYYEKVNDIKAFEKNLDLDPTLRTDKRRKYIKITKAFELKLSKLRKRVRIFKEQGKDVESLKNHITKMQTEYLKRTK